LKMPRRISGWTAALFNQKKPRIQGAKEPGVADFWALSRARGMPVLIVFWHR
jgi:hypothetical protein